jgi:hypothetical protein
MAGFQADSKLEDLIVSILESGATAFVETGTGQGDSSNAIARRTGKPVLTCDVSEDQLRWARQLLPAHVEPALMSSEKFIPSVKGQAGDLPLFFLDAHWQDYWPLLDELRAIQEHYERGVIIVHDVRVPGRDSQYSYCVGGGGTMGITRTVPGEGINNLNYIRPVLTKGRYQFLYPDYTVLGETPGYLVAFWNTKPIGHLGQLTPVLDVTVVISTVDEYRALWRATCHGLQKYWPDCPWPIVWYTNEKKAPCGQTIKTGKKRNWAHMTRKAMDKVLSPVVLLMMGDVWLFRKVDTDNLVKLAGAMIKSGADQLQLQSPFKNGRREVEFFDGLYMLPFGVTARTSLQPAFWQVTSLLDLLQDDDEIPGDFEGRAGIRKQGGLFLGIKEAGIGFVNPVERGRWVDVARQYAENEGLAIDMSEDPIGGFRQTARLSGAK